MPRPPILSIVGRKHSGKTTLITVLAAELKRRGHRVMIVKHGSHTFSIDPATTDTYRHYHEGAAERVAMVSPDKFALVVRSPVELEPEAVVDRYMADADVVLCEGFKRSSLPRIEVFRLAAHTAPLYDPAAENAHLYLAAITDDPTYSPPIVTFHFSSPTWRDALTDFVEGALQLRARRSPPEPA